VGRPSTEGDIWASGESYEPYVGRWSRLVAQDFLSWLDLPAGCRWLDVGCGTGALSETVLARGFPSGVVGVDPSSAFVRYAAAHALDSRASFAVGDARALPVGDASFDAVVSGLMLNFVPDRNAALGEMRRAARDGGAVAAYVWDYPGEMQLMRHFWDTAVELDPAARPMHEGVRFGFCRPEPLRTMFAGAGFDAVEVDAIVVPTVFPDFDDYWSPFLSGQAPAPSYARSLSDAGRSALRNALRARLPIEDDGSIHLTARAWAVRGSSG
jgi:SAM-dependent methyltransferase